MERTEEKLQKFMTLVLQEATQKKQDMLKEAELRRKQKVEQDELRLLQDAHEAIQDSLRNMGKASNEEVSRTILESKQALFTRREEIIAAVFDHVSDRLKAFRASDEYRKFLEEILRKGYAELGDGEIQVAADPEDIPLFEEIVKALQRKLMVVEAADVLLGGCLYINKTTSRMCNFSLKQQLDVEKRNFLERYSLRLDG